MSTVSKEGFLLEGQVHSLDFKEKIYSYRDQERIMDGWLKKRFKTVLPQVMKRSGIDCWIVACNEYNEDPVLKTIVPRAMMNARRFTILVFFLNEKGEVERYNITRPGVGLEGFYTQAWINSKGHDWGALYRLDDPENVDSIFKDVEPETQLECLNRILKIKNPKKIGINMSKDFAFADGLTATIYQDFLENFDEDVKAKLCSAENICVGWLETRTDEEVAAYTGIMQIAHGIIAEAYSSRIITPGVTTNADVKYFILQRVFDLGLQPWFDFSVDLKRQGVGDIEEETVILPGDILHCDVGLNYLGLCTDTQENCYILKMEETDVPETLKKAMKTVNRLQDIVIGEYVEGRTGNEILALSRKKAIEEGINPCIYTHPIGYHGHAAGPTIGLFDMQDGVPGRGDYPLYDHTFYSLELNCTLPLEGWGDFRMSAETDIMFVDGKVHYVAGRQEKWHLVK